MNYASPQGGDIVLFVFGLLMVGKVLVIHLVVIVFTLEIEMEVVKQSLLVVMSI